jgi:hypothetical protein
MISNNDGAEAGDRVETGLSSRRRVGSPVQYIDHNKSHGEFV